MLRGMSSLSRFSKCWLLWGTPRAARVQRSRQPSVPLAVKQYPKNFQRELDAHLALDQSTLRGKRRSCRSGLFIARFDNPLARQPDNIGILSLFLDEGILGRNGTLWPVGRSGYIHRRVALVRWVKRPVAFTGIYGGIWPRTPLCINVIQASLGLLNKLVFSKPK